VEEVTVANNEALAIAGGALIVVGALTMLVMVPAMATSSAEPVSEFGIHPLLYGILGGATLMVAGIPMTAVGARRVVAPTGEAALSVSPGASGLCITGSF